jgi:hypothetical protein
VTSPHVHPMFLLDDFGLLELQRAGIELKAEYLAVWACETCGQVEAEIYSKGP